MLGLAREDERQSVKDLTRKGVKENRTLVSVFFLDNATSFSEKGALACARFSVGSAQGKCRDSDVTSAELTRPNIERQKCKRARAQLDFVTRSDNPVPNGDSNSERKETSLLHNRNKS